MIYVRSWERLRDALSRVRAECDISEDQAKTEICQAIADGAIRIRGKLGSHSTKRIRASATVFSEDLAISTNLKPEDLDWEESRPVKPWVVPRGRFEPSGYWHLSWIELSSTDVTRVLCGAVARSAATEHTADENAKPGASRPARQPTNASPGPGQRSAIAPGKREAAEPARRRGRRPQKFEETRKAMRNDLEQGRCTKAELKDMVEKVLAERYGVSRDTARRARAAVWSELSRT